jgi:hypothetical protein
MREDVPHEEYGRRETWERERKRKKDVSVCIGKWRGIVT